MENGAREAPVRPRNLLAELLGPEALKGPGVLPLAAAGHVALITSAQPETLSMLWRMAALNPVLASASVVIVALASVQLSRQLEGRMTIEYHFSQPDPGVTLFTRTMTIEAYRDAPMGDGFFRIVNPSHIDAYHAAVARELDALS